MTTTPHQSLRTSVESTPDRTGDVPCEQLTDRAPASPLPDVESPSVMREVRAYERARQRAWRTQERARMLEAKDPMFQHVVHRSSPRCHQSTHGRRIAQRINASTAHGEDGLHLAVDTSGAAAEQDENSPSHPAAVTLDITPLLKPAKGRRNKAGEYELVPSLRPVIALDDLNLMEIQPNYDDEWEHIERDDIEHRAPVPRPTYAVVASAL